MRLITALLAFMPCLCVVAAPATIALAAPYIFTDGKAVIAIPDAPAEVGYRVTTITWNGWGPTGEGKMVVKEGAIEIAPLTEGIHIITLALAKPAEVRFLAIAPPLPFKAKDVKTTLPHAWKKLLGGEKVTFLSMGDSVTYSGDYEGMLVMMLKRATGNQQISYFERSYPGRSVDAAVRFFQDDALPNKPDVGLLMYGLNDFNSGCSLEGYLDQYRWVAERMAADCGADTVFLTPTPDNSIWQGFTEYHTGYFQTLGFASPLGQLAREIKVPLADTFHALWGTGGKTVDASGKAMWPLFPLDFSAQFTSMIESGGRGDGIHANALGHLAIAKSVYQAMLGIPPAPQPLTITASSAWTKNGLVSHVTVRNNTNSLRDGALRIYGLPSGEVQATLPDHYTLAPGKSLHFDIAWPQVKTPDSLLTFPSNMYIAPGRPYFAAIDFYGDGSSIYAVSAPMEVDAGFVRERQVAVGNSAIVKLRAGKKVTPIIVDWPKDAEVGRIPLKREITQGKQAGWAVAELVYIRYGEAKAGEATVDGNLDEWTNHHWSPVGEQIQARWTQGIRDLRAIPEECYLRWSCKAGKEGLYLAGKVTGDVRKDAFTLFFDPRTPDLLGTPGRYYWANGSFKENGAMSLSKGETSKQAPGITGTWKPANDGMTFELFIPYALMEMTIWPNNGDLGLSIWWCHPVKEGEWPMNLLWSDDGHPWNTRWYGVVRLDNGNGQPLPYMVRVK